MEEEEEEKNESFDEAKKNANCVGPSATTAGKASACDGCPNQKECASGKFQNVNNGEKTEEEFLISLSARASRELVGVLFVTEGPDQRFFLRKKKKSVFFIILTTKTAKGGLASRLAECKRVVLVLSGKGGVGKSTMAQAMARELSETSKVGLLDIDICGPSVPTMTKKKVPTSTEATAGGNRCT